MSKLYELNTADVLDHLAIMEANSLDGCLCDPPYGLNFMGKRWDHGVPSKKVWEEVLRVLKPGAFLMAFGGTRTFHRLTVAIEDAGFEIRDCLSWVYGSGFPKSLNISKAFDRAQGKLKTEGSSFTVAGYSHKPDKIQHTAPSKGYEAPKPQTSEAQQWEGYGTALKPAWEPIILAQKPREGTFVNNVLKYGVGGLNIDGCRVPVDGTRTVKTGRSNPKGGKVKSTDYGEFEAWDGGYKTEEKGRWPANLIHDGSKEVVEEFPVTKTGKVASHSEKGMWGSGADTSYNDPNGSGSAARFFYCAKASKKERNVGLEELQAKKQDGSRNASQSSMNDGKGNPYNHGVKPIKNNHPTVKPLALLKYLAKLILPAKCKGSTRTLFVPFSGSGSEMIGGLQAGWDKVVGIEQEANYNEIAEARLKHHVKNGEQMELLE